MFNTNESAGQHQTVQYRAVKVVPHPTKIFETEIQFGEMSAAEFRSAPKDWTFEELGRY